MHSSRRDLILGSVLASAAAAQAARGAVTRLVRFSRGNSISHGILEGDAIQPVAGNIFGSYKSAGAKVALTDAKLLAPCTPSKILAVGLNYRSHIGSAKPPSNPEIFYKPITCVQNPGGPIVIPPGANNVHYEGELVLVIGKRASQVSAAQAKEVIFGVTCGNDVSERDWQGGPAKDMQWWRAKGADTFGPLGPAIATGLNYGDLLLQTRLNGDVVQKQRTSDLLFTPEAIVSYISRYVTIMPGDVIFTGTPGATRKMKPGDTVEVEIEGIGILKNVVEAPRA